ncbi:MAG: NAD(P)(+) transhydrogenase (Re/Si-specific) subunit alpha, partial [Pseudomonadota bacterium]|nr:NAD(P)(+) transhydrogenase (Re/Si-specific) subunit alpha [Pseudomonadota bacterium]
MKIGIPKEVHSGEQRVALTPETAGRIQKLGFEISVESGAGEAAQFSDAAYREAGVEVVDETRALWANSDIIMKVRQPEAHPGLGVDETELLPEKSTLISFIWPAQNPNLLENIKARNATA